VADNIYDPKGTLIVFNPLNWERSNLVEFDLAKGLELVELNTKLVVPFQVLSTGASYRHVRLMADHVPPVGANALP
jgi:alpha-mannosidase